MDAFNHVRVKVWKQQPDEFFDCAINIAQLKQCALAAPLSDLTSNWAYMVIASLAWNLKIWSALMIRPVGKADQKAEQSAMKSKLLHMDFTTFRDRILMVPAQIIRRSRSVLFRTL